MNNLSNRRCDDLREARESSTADSVLGTGSPGVNPLIPEPAKGLLSYYSGAVLRLNRVDSSYIQHEQYQFIDLDILYENVDDQTFCFFILDDRPRVKIKNTTTALIRYPS